MSVTVHLRAGSAIDLDPISAIGTTPAVLVSLRGEVHGKVINCALIPAHKIQQTIDALILVRDQAVRDAIPLS